MVESAESDEVNPQAQQFCREGVSRVVSPSSVMITAA